MFKNATIYRFNEFKSIPAFEDHLSENCFQPCGLSQQKSLGWVPPRGEEHGAFLENVGGELVAKLQIETRCVPASAINSLVKQRCADIERGTGRKPGTKERRDLAEEAMIELLPKAFPKRTALMIWIDRTRNLVWIDSTSKSGLDDAITALVASSEGLVLTLVSTMTSPSVMMAKSVHDGSCGHPFELGRACELKASDDSKAVVRYKNHTLDCDEIRGHVQTGMIPMALQMTWSERVSFTLTAVGTLKTVEFLESVLEGGSKDEDRFDTDVTIVTQELRNLMDDLVQWLGGVVEDPAIASTPATTTPQPAEEVAFA